MFCQLQRDRKISLRVGTELKFEYYESVQHRLQFSGIKKEAKFHFMVHVVNYVSKVFLFQYRLAVGLNWGIAE